MTGTLPRVARPRGTLTDEHSDEAVAGRSILKDYGLDAGDVVEVELLVTDAHTGNTPRLVEGIVVAATTLIVCLEHPNSHTITRIPWHAIALIRNAVTPHPANR